MATADDGEAVRSITSPVRTPGVSFLSLLLALAPHALKFRPGGRACTRVILVPVVFDAVVV